MNFNNFAKKLNVEILFDSMIEVLKKIGHFMIKNKNETNILVIKERILVSDWKIVN